MVKYVFDKDGKKVATVKTDVEVKREAGGQLIIVGLLATASLPITLSFSVSHILSQMGMHSLIVFIAFCGTFYGVVKLSFRSGVTKRVAAGLTILINSILMGIFMNALLDDKIWAGVFAIGAGYATYWILTNFVAQADL